MFRKFILLLFVYIGLFHSISSSEGLQNVGDLHNAIFLLNLKEDKLKEAKILLQSYHEKLKHWWYKKYQADIAMMNEFVTDDFNKDTFTKRSALLIEKKEHIDAWFLISLHKLLSYEERVALSKYFSRIYKPAKLLD